MGIDSSKYKALPPLLDPINAVTSCMPRVTHKVLCAHIYGG